MKNIFRIVLFAVGITFNLTAAFVVGSSVIGCDFPVMDILKDSDIKPIPVDTIPPPVPLEDTCTVYTPVTEPAFISAALDFDTPISTPTWTMGSLSSTDLCLVIHNFYPTLDCDVYHQGGHWFIILTGTNNTALFNKPTPKLSVRDGNGIKYLVTFAQQYLITSGAVTFDEFNQLTLDYPSVRGFNFRNTAYDSLQYIQLEDNILGDCKQGQYWADFRFNPFEVPDSIVQAFKDAGWQKVLN